jgi:hypothetical protein
MNSTEPDNLPRVQTVSAARAPWTLNVVWADDTKSRVDLTGLIYRSRHFRTFLGDPASFRRVKVADFGVGIEWDNGIDYGADTLKMVADEQRPMTGADLKVFESESALSTAETANLLGVAARTVRAYRAADALPQAVAMAVRKLWSSSTVLAAHYRPAGHHTQGRPKKEAAPPRHKGLEALAAAQPSPQGSSTRSRRAR